MSSENNQVFELVKFLQLDASAPIPKQPSQALYSLKNEKVQIEIQRRFERGEKITEIKLLPYDILTGLNRVYFRFKNDSGIELQESSVLVLLDADLVVKGIIEDFDPERPNKYLVINASPENLPFVLAQPSPMRTVKFETDDLKPREERTKAFIDRVFTEIPISGSANTQRTFSAFPPDAHTSICRWLSSSELTQQPDVRPPFISNWKGDDNWDSDSDDCLP